MNNSPILCLYCNTPVPKPLRGRSPKFCSPAHRVAHLRANPKPPTSPTPTTQEALPEPPVFIPPILESIIKKKAQKPSLYIHKPIPGNHPAITPDQRSKFRPHTQFTNPDHPIPNFRLVPIPPDLYHDPAFYMHQGQPPQPLAPTEPQPTQAPLPDDPF